MYGPPHQRDPEGTVPSLVSEFAPVSRVRIIRLSRFAAYQAAGRERKYAKRHGLKPQCEMLHSSRIRPIEMPIHARPVNNHRP
jgi:hypothetical protein